ncbi:hypothetical protein [Streptomyces sp. NPDC059491]|uniref:hypothetical protein n=1 Tax=Streptomyces sp. NPDC059491 TaxID=3346850 RepID=UPI00368E24BC
MNGSIHASRGWRLIGRLAAACGLAGAMTLTGLPGSGLDPAAAAPTSVKIGGQRCDTKHVGRPYATTPRNSGFPDDPTGNFAVWAGDPKNYNYALPGQAYDGLGAPTEAQKTEARSQDPDPKKNYDKWARIAAASGKPSDKSMEIYARYLANKEGLSFKHWFDKRYIRNETNNHKGSSFERRLVKDFQLVGPDWLCEVKVEVFDENGKKIAERRYDAYNQRTKEFNEFKSNSKLRNDQLKVDRMIAEVKKDHTFRFNGGKTFSKGERAKIDRFNRELEQSRGKPNQVRGFQRQYNAIPQTKPIRGYSQYDKWFAPGCAGATAQAAPASSCGTRGPANDRIKGSGRTLDEARRIQAEARRLDTRGTLPRGGPGGIDFTTLELRFVGGLEKGKGMAYSMKADLMPDPDETPGFGGEAKMTMASDALFTWLALTPDRMWVNLNPDQPETIMDKEFAKTDAGRVLLQADMEMKRDYGRAMDPETEVGDRFWDSLPRRNGFPCLHSGRYWIEPEPAQVREQDGGLYILDAPLNVKSVAQKYDTPGPGGEGCDLTEAEIKQGQASIDTMLTPIVKKLVNESPKYADLRRVYTSRVAAEWIRQQDARKASDFRPIIDSNDVSRWPLRAPHADWDKKTVFDEMVKSFKEGDFRYELKYGGEVAVYMIGGVDFTKAPKQNISRTRFQVENRTLDTTTRTSLQSDDTSYRDTDISYAGGDASGDTSGGGDDDPTPTPTPHPTQTGTPRPTDTPTAPGPAPSTPGTVPTTPPAHTPDGGLADTGSDTPVGLLVTVAAALAAVGGALTWWMRRRRGDSAR